MSKSTDNLILLIKAGGNLSIDASNIHTENIIKITKVAIETNRRVVFRNLSGKSTDNLIQIIKAGGDNITIEV